MTRSMPAEPRLGIGQVLAELRAEFPDVSVSKIRFLETAGLVRPERTPSGYRKYSSGDVARLRYVLAAQRDRYLPLRVIKQDLDALERGLEPAGGSGRPRVPEAALHAASDPFGEGWNLERPMLRLSRAMLAEAAAISPELLDKIEGFGLVAPRPGTEDYDADALLVATAVGELAEFGLEPRHLRVIKTAADRHVSLVGAAVTPLRRQRGSAARERAEQAVASLASASVRLHATLVRIGLRSEDSAS